jgi:phytoene dehydrogenase-like protein
MTAPAVQGLAIFPDGSHVCLWKDLDRTVRELERISQREAQGFLEFGIRLRRFRPAHEAVPVRADPPKRSEVMKAFEDAGERNSTTSSCWHRRTALSKNTFIRPCRGLLTFLGLVSVWAGPDTPEGAYLYGYHAIGEFEDTIGRWAFVKGGMGGITQALARAAESQGVEIRVNATVSEIIVEGGHVGGVRLASGEELKAVVVVSNAHPKLTFLKLLQPRHLTSRFKEAVERIDTKGAMARAHLLVDQLPHYVGFESAVEGWQHRGLVVLGCSIENYHKAHAAQLEVSSRTSWQWSLSSNRFSDPTLAPKGQHNDHIGRPAYAVRSGEGGLGLAQTGMGRPWSARTCFAMRPTSGSSPWPPHHHSLGPGARLRSRRREHLSYSDDDGVFVRR